MFLRKKPVFMLSKSLFLHKFSYFLSMDISFLDI
jgi:hypothetical protein